MRDTLMSYLIFCSPCLQARSADLLRGCNLIERPSVYITFPCSECGTQTRQRSAWWQQELPLLRQPDEGLCVRCADDAARTAAHEHVLRLIYLAGVLPSLPVGFRCNRCDVRDAEILLESDGPLSEPLCVWCADDAQTAAHAAHGRVLRLTHNEGLESSLRVSGGCHRCRVRDAEIRLDSDGPLYRQIGEILPAGATADP